MPPSSRCALTAGRCRTDRACRLRPSETACSEPGCGGRQPRCSARAGLRGAPRLGAGSLLLAGIAGQSRCSRPAWRPRPPAAWRSGREASENGAAARAARVVAAVSASSPALVVIGNVTAWNQASQAITMIENLIDHHDSQVLVVAAVDLGSDLEAALTSRARYGPTAGRVHRVDADPRMGARSRAELAGELKPHLTAAQARVRRRTRTFAEIFAAARSEPLP